MSERIDCSPEVFRDALEELFAFIPYFEERVNGTFKFQYFDDKTNRLVDYEGYEEKNRVAKFPDPVYDKTFGRFKRIFLEKIWMDVESVPRPSVDKQEELSFQELFLLVIFELARNIFHERMCTGNTAGCMARGSYLVDLNVLQGMLNGNVKTLKDIEAIRNGI